MAREEEDIKGSFISSSLYSTSPTPTTSATKQAWDPTFQNSRLQSSVDEKEFPRLPIAAFVYFHNPFPTTTTSDEEEQHQPAPRATPRLLWFRNRKEMSAMYDQLMELYGLNKVQEVSWWKGGLINSKKSFVEHELAELERMGFSKSKYK